MNPPDMPLDDTELEKLEEIHNDVHQTRTRIEVIDERTRSMNARMNSMDQEINKNTDDIDALEENVERNKTILGGFVTGVTGVFVWALNKLRII
jgi:peptidoglycan hydrolase CwlO-like protein